MLVPTLANIGRVLWRSNNYPLWSWTYSAKDCTKILLCRYASLSISKNALNANVARSLTRKMQVLYQHQFITRKSSLGQFLSFVRRNPYGEKWIFIIEDTNTEWIELFRLVIATVEECDRSLVKHDVRHVVQSTTFERESPNSRTLV